MLHDSPRRRGAVRLAAAASSGSRIGGSPFEESLRRLSGGATRGAPGLTGRHYAVRVADATTEATIVTANEASWGDLQAIFGTRGDPSRCWCQRFKVAPGESWGNVGAAQHAFRLRTQTRCGHPESDTTSGLVAYLDGEPVGWCGVEPRTAYPRMLRNNGSRGREGARTRPTAACGPQPASSPGRGSADKASRTHLRAPRSSSRGSAAPVPLRATR